MAWAFQATGVSGTFFTSSLSTFKIAGPYGDRHGLTLYNATSSSLYVMPGLSASLSTSHFMVKVPADSYYEWPSQAMFVGPIYGVFDGTTSGSLNVIDLGA